MKISNIRKIKNKNLIFEADFFLEKVKKLVFSAFLKTKNTLSGDLGGN